MNSYYFEKELRVLKYIDSICSGYRTFPPSLHISLTDKCFNKCIMCDHHKRKNFHQMDKKVLLSFLNRAKSKGVQSVCYTGGDPLAHPCANEIVAWHIATKIPFGIVTSGHVPDKINVKNLTKAQFIRVSLDSISNYDKTRGGITFNQVDKGIKKLLKHKANIQICTTVHAGNYKQLGEIFDYAADNKIRSVRTWLVRGRPDLLPDPNKLKDVVKYIIHFGSKGVNHNLDVLLTGEKVEFKKCWACKFQRYIDAQGDIYPCCMVAGDTGLKSIVKPLGHIEDEIFTIVDAVEKFSEKPLLKYCKENCILRLSTINAVVDKYNVRGDFF